MSVVGSGNRVTYTEVHASILGVAVGALAAYAVELGYQSVGVGLGALLVGLALGFDVRGRVTAAQRTLSREPWYALAGFVLAGALVLAFA